MPSGSRASVEFEQNIQNNAAETRKATLPALIIAPFYQIIEPIIADAANPNALARNVSGDVLLYDGEKLVGADDPDEGLVINFWTDPANRTGAIALPSLIEKSLILPNERVLGAVTSDQYFSVYLNTVGTDDFVELVGPGVGPNYDFDTVVYATPSVGATGETIGIVLKPGLADSNGSPYSSLKKARVVIGLRALRRDYVRTALETDATTFNSIAGGVYGPENPAALALQKVFEASPDSKAYMIALDEVTDSAPDGTYAAYQRALKVAATIDGYNIPVLTYDKSIQNLIKNHVLSMSTAEGQKERRCFVGRELPTRGPDNILVSGAGDLRLVAAATNVGEAETVAGVDVWGELVQAGATLNGKVSLTLQDVSAGAVAAFVEYAGKERLTAVIATGSVTAGTSKLTAAVADLATPAGFDVGDLIRFELTDTAMVVDAAAQTIQEPGRNFKLAGAVVNGKVTVTRGGTPYRYAINRILTTDSVSDTLELVPVGHNDLLDETETAYSVEVDTAITAIDDSGTPVRVLTVAAVFDVTSAGAFSYQYVSGDSYEIVVDYDDVAVGPDSYQLVDLLNTDIDVAALATFYVGAEAERGVEVGPVAPAVTVSFAGGSNLYNQFYTNADISSLDTGTTHYVDFESENRDAQITAFRPWNGSVIVSDPGSASDPDLDNIKDNESYSIYTLGDLLVIETPIGQENDLNAQASTLALYPANFNSRRVLSIWPDVAVTTINSVSQEVPGYYLGATLAGLISVLNPEQGHSELPIPGWDALRNSNGYFDESHLTTLTGAGWWVYVQDVEDGPVVCRKQYTTDVSSDTTAEASIVVITDNFQKDVRATIRPLLGVNNLTTDIIERSRLLINAVAEKYKKRQAMKSFTLNSLEPDPTSGNVQTSLISDVTITFYGPYNKLRMRINI